MRIRYKLPITGRRLLPFSFPIQAAAFTYEFEVDKDGIATHLQVTSTPLEGGTETASWRPHFHLSHPRIEELRKRVRAISGMLAIYGVDHIETEAIELGMDPGIGGRESRITGVRIHGQKGTQTHL